MPLFNDYHPIAVHREPIFEGEGLSQCNFYLSKSALQQVEDDGPEWKYYDARLIEPCLLSPLLVFEGLNREEYKDGYCYVSKPEFWWESAENPDAPQEDHVFLVYVKKQYGLVVFDWAWRLESESDPSYPLNWERDFEKGRIWPTH